VWDRLLGLLVARGYWKEAEAVGASAIFVDVANPEVHRLYARALARRGKFISAIFELNSALKARPKPAAAAKIYAMMAEGYRKLGRKDYADKAARYAGQVKALARPESPPQ
jgi:predicted Zn-dependent protease